MLKEIKMPKLGESVVEGVVVRWLKNVGEHVLVDEPLVEIETDKVNVEIPSAFQGRILEVLAEPGESVPVGKTLCVIDERSADGDGEPGESEGELSDSGSWNSPAVLRLSQEHDIDLKTIKGTGQKGRITKKDVLQAIENKSRTLAPQQAPNVHDDDQILLLSGMRKNIALRMSESKATVPHAWTMVEVDVTDLVEFRESIKEEFRKIEGVNLTYFPFVIKAAVEGLKQYPILNSMWQDDRILIKKKINIGVAVDLEDGLLVPVIKDADKKSIAQIAKEVADLAARARGGKLNPDEAQGGTFTVNNTGAFGSILSAPIINHPQAAIMSMETITKRPVVINDAIAIRSMLNLCISLDHRILDGAVCGRFLRVVKKELESFNRNTQLYS
jgi:2-oxoisovalerate dehydrogenase E2 component (dihydrolipoyl transacylase)